jgi:hypothetical protein
MTTGKVREIIFKNLFDASSIDFEFPTGNEKWWKLLTDLAKDQINEYSNNYFKQSSSTPTSAATAAVVTTAPITLALEGIRYPNVISLESIPSTIKLPSTINIRYDELAKCLVFEGEMLAKEKKELGDLDSSPTSPYKTSILQLFDNSKKRIKRAFMADLVWLFYFERLGIFKILGAILDDYVIKGKFSVENIHSTVSILEKMTQLTKMGISSTVRDRDSSYRRCLGWTSDLGRNMGSDALVNNGFNNLFHKLIQSSLEYYKDKRLAQAIQTTPTSRPSAATVETIKDTINVLKKSIEPFKYGRNHYNTVNGILWVITGMALIRELKDKLGIPFSEIHQYIPAAYSLLVEQKPATSYDTNRYEVHKKCADNGRRILLEVEQLDPTNSDQITAWLDSEEDGIEGYRTAYRSLTGVDLGASGTPAIEQQA